GPAARTAMAEIHQVLAAGHALNLHLAQAAALTAAGGNRGHGQVEHDHAT
ncbi:MAG: hypothetical protein RLZZ336_126, partial [Cyanobacteriota bacterium]